MLGGIAGLALAVSTGFAAAAPEPTQTLADEKLQAEIDKLNEETERIRDDRSGLGWLLRLAPFITALVALGGLFLTLSKQRSESSRLAGLDLEERSKARLQRFDVQFQQAAENLGSEKGEIRAAAAASITTFIRPEYSDFHERLFLLLLGALRFPRKDYSDKLLVRTFDSVAGPCLAELRAQNPSMRLDLANCWLQRANLARIDLSGADVAFADLHGADLSEADLRRVRGIEVDLSDARMSKCDLQEARLYKANLIKARFAGATLVSAQLKRVDATGAAFPDARLQEAHFEGATLHGARFENADLNNAFFAGARLDSSSLRSIALNAKNWRKAHWDAAVKDELEQLSSS